MCSSSGEANLSTVRTLPDRCNVELSIDFLSIVIYCLCRSRKEDGRMPRENAFGRRRCARAQRRLPLSELRAQGGAQTRWAMFRHGLSRVRDGDDSRMRRT